MQFDPVDYPGQGTPIYGALPPRGDLWTYGDLAKFVLFSVVAQFVCLFAALLGVPPLLAAVDQHLGLRPDLDTAIDYGVVAATVSAVVASLGYLRYIIAIKCRLPFWETLGFTPFRPPMYGFLLVGALISIWHQWLGGVIGAPTATSLEAQLGSRNAHWPMAAVIVLVLPPFYEVVFRGFLYRPLERSWGTIGAIAVTSVVFSAVQGPQYAWTWQFLLTPLLSGVWLGLARWKTGSLWPPILMHGGANLFSVVALGLEKSV